MKTNNKITLLLSLFFILLTANSFACDKSTLTINSITNNGDGTYTYNVSVCIETRADASYGNGHLVEFSFPATNAKIISINPTSLTFSQGTTWSTISGLNTTKASISGTGINFTAASGGHECFSLAVVLDRNPTTASTSDREYTISIGHASGSCEKTHNYYCSSCPNPPPVTTPPCSTPATPTVSDINYCQGDVAVALTATGTGTLNWYGTAATGGSSSATAPTPSTASASTTSYYVSQTVSGCESTRAKIDVIVNTSPVLNITNPAAVCSPNTVDITAASVTTGSTGGGTLTYWTDAGGTTSLSNPTAISVTNTYYIKSTVGTCVDIEPVTVTINTSPVLNITNPTSVCSPNTVDITNPAVTSGSTGGGTLSYWTNNLGTTSLSNPNAISTSGTYYIKSTLGSCTDIDPVSVTINTTPVLNITDPNPTCTPNTLDLTNSSITAGSTGSGTLTYWNDLGATSTISNPTAISVAGTYYIKSANGSCSDIKPVTVSFTTSPVLIITNPTAVCSPNTIDITDPSTTAGSMGGGTLSYWNDAGATSSLSNPNAIATTNTYYIQSTVGTCSDIKPVTVTINTSPVLTITNPTTICSPNTIDLTAGSITSGSSGGGTLTYWSDAGATTSLSNYTAVATSNTYYIKSTVGSCSDTKPVTVTINTPPSLVITNPSAVCSPATIDLTLASITSGSTGGGALSYWSDAAATSAIASPTTINTSGTYYIKSDDGTCSDTKAVNVLINNCSCPLALNITDPSSVCTPSTVDITQASVTAGSTGGGALTYWTDNGATNPLSNPSSIATTGIYYIKSDNGSCSDIQPVNVTVNQSPSLVINTPTPICAPATFDLTASSITSGSTGGGTLSYWTDLAATSPLASSTAISTTGTYYIKATNGSCSDIQPVTLTINPTPILSITNPPSKCSPDGVDLTDPMIVAGSVNAGTFTYYEDGPATITVSTPTNVTISKTYYIRSTTGTCFDIQPVVVNIITSPNLSITDPATVCMPSTVDITAASITSGSTGGGTLSYWTDINATSSLSNPSSINTSGTYYIVATNSICADTQAVNVTINNCSCPLVLNITDPSPVCNPNTVNLTNPSITSGSTGGGAFTYFTDSLLTSPLTNPSAVSTSGRYFILSDNGACSDTAGVNVTILTPPTLLTTNPNYVCAPNTIDLTNPSIISGSTIGTILTYWTDNAATIPVTNPTAITLNGIYYIKSDNGTCSTIKSVTAPVKPSPIVIITTPSSICQPNTIDLTSSTITSGSTAGLTFNYWTDNSYSTSITTPNAITTSGTYYIEGNDGFCSTYEPITLTINPIPTLTITNPATVCSPTTIDLTNSAITSGTTLMGTLSYWSDLGATSVLSNPSSISSSGNYYIQNTLNGCSDIQAVTITINTTPTLIVNNPSSVCTPSTIDLTLASVTSGSSPGILLSYWQDNAATLSLTNPSVINSSNTYYIKGEINGCSSIQAVTTTVNAGPDLVVNDPSPVCSPSTIDITLPVITVGSTGGGTLSYWNDANETSPLANANAITVSGIYYIKSDNGTCNDIQPVNVVINTNPSLSITDPAAVCSPTTVDITNPSVTLGSTGGGTISYHTNLAGTISLTNPGSISTSGTYYIKAANGICFDIKPVVVTINTPSTLTLNNDGPICEGQNVSLIATPSSGSSIVWSGPNSYTGNNLSETINSISLNQSGVYSATITDINNCQTTNTTTVTVNPKDVVVFQTNTNYCKNDSPFNLSATPTGGTWSGTGITSGSIGTFDPALTTQKNTKVYYLTNGSCPTNDSVTIVVNKIPDINFFADKDSICEKQSIIFTDISEDLNTSLLWDFGDGNTTNALVNTTHTYLNSGYYTVSLTSILNGCSNTITKTNFVKVLAKPTASFSFDPEKPSLFNSNVQFTNLSINANSYKWYFGDGKIGTEINPLHSYAPEANDFTVKLIAYSIPTCADTTSLSFSIPEEIYYYIPNTFTPNDDEVNNEFKPIFSNGISPNNYSLYIFNRWGELLFESHNKEVGWDGTYGEKVSLPDTYIWKVEFKEELSNKKHVEVGHVNLVK